ncbi:MAG: hypothetical protein RR685_03495 [Hungatella sp.]
MTHVYAYIKEGYSKEQIQQLICKIKSAISEGFHIDDRASTVAIKELAEDCYSDNFGSFILVYTAKGNGFDIKKKFAKLLNHAFTEVLGDGGEVRMVMKEQANDMVGLNGNLCCNSDLE